MRTRIIITQLTTAINSEPYKSPIKSRKSYGLEFLRSYLRPTIAWTQWYRRIVASARRSTTWKIETSRGILESSILWGSGNRVSRRLEKAFVTSLHDWIRQEPNFQLVESSSSIDHLEISFCFDSDGRNGRNKLIWYEWRRISLPVTFSALGIQDSTGYLGCQLSRVISIQI